VTARVDDSAYAGIVRLATEASAHRAPLVRVADRAALVLLVVGLAWSASAWAITGELSRAVAVLVVATPCPLILAVPIALSGGLATTARRGVLVRGGDALERLAGATALLVDKTGTLTEGRPHVVAVEVEPPARADDVLRLAAAADAGSSHVVAMAVVQAARERQPALPSATEAVEQPGEGVAAEVEGRAVRVGSAGWIAPDGHSDAGALARAERVAVRAGGMVVAVRDPTPEAPCGACASWGSDTWRWSRATGPDRLEPWHGWWAWTRCSARRTRRPSSGPRASCSAQATSS
jgi:cation transport ATPase